MRGNSLDTNENAGLDLLEGITTGPTTTKTYTSTTPVQIPATQTIVSSINISDSYDVSGATVQLNIATTNDPGLQVELVSPTNVPILLIPYGTGNGGNKTNFSNTIFNDAAATLITNGSPGFFGSFQPITPLSTLNGILTNGTWKLIVSDNPTDTTGAIGTLNSWSISFQPTTTKTYTSTTPVRIPATQTIVSSINISDSYDVSGATVQLNIATTNDPGLQVELVSPTNVPILLIPYGTGNGGNKTNFSNTIFNDAAATLITNGSPGFFGSFQPITPLSTLNGILTNGTWKLIVSDNPTDTTGAIGTLNSWSISFQKGSSSSGLGEPVADQYTGSFRIFNASATNPLASTTWTSVGPASVVSTTGNQTNNGFAGTIGTVAVDPSDPSGTRSTPRRERWRLEDHRLSHHLANGPTWIPLTYFGPTSGLYIGSITVFDRNNDPNQSIIIAGTGTADETGSNNGITTFSNPNTGGRLPALGGRRGDLDPAGQHQQQPAVRLARPLLRARLEPQRGGRHWRDPELRGWHHHRAGRRRSEPDAIGRSDLLRRGEVADLQQRRRLVAQHRHRADLDELSSDSLGNATSVSLDLTSATVNAVSNPTGNVNIIYAAFPGTASTSARTAARCST